MVSKMPRRARNDYKKLSNVGVDDRVQDGQPNGTADVEGKGSSKECADMKETNQDEPDTKKDGDISHPTAVDDSSMTVNGSDSVPPAQSDASPGQQSGQTEAEEDNGRTKGCDEKDHEKHDVKKRERGCSINIGSGNDQKTIETVDGKKNAREQGKDNKTGSGIDSEKGCQENNGAGNIPGCTITPEEEQLKVEDDGEWHYINKNDPDNMENQILANCPYRLYLITTFQWRPYTDSWQNQKRKWIPFCCGQFLILCLLALSFVFDGGWFCKVDTILSYDWDFEITRIRGILWEARWFLGNIIGLWYFRTRHLEWFLKAIHMPQSIWTNFYKRANYFMVFLMLACIFIPTGMQVFMINAYSKETLPLWTQAVHMIGYAMRRYTTFPIFLALISMLYLLDLFINVSGELVTYRLLYALRTPEKEEEAKAKQGAIKRASSASLETIGQMKGIIFKTENGVKYFMLFHLVMLLITTFLGIFSYMERLEFSVKSSSEGNLTNKLSLTNSLDNKTIMMQQRIREAIVNLMEVQQAHRSTANNEPLTQSLVQIFNETLRSISDVSQGNKEENLKMVLQGQEPQSIEVMLREQINRTRLYVQIGLDCVETALLYGLPLFLLIKIDSSVAALKECMIDMQAKQMSLKFEMTKQVWDVITFMGTVRGIRVFGFQSTLFRTLILTFAGPILLSVVHSLLTYVKLPK